MEDIPFAFALLHNQYAHFLPTLGKIFVIMYVGKIFCYKLWKFIKNYDILTNTLAILKNSAIGRREI